VTYFSLIDFPHRFAGGHGARWDFPTSEDARALTSGICTRGGVVGAVCHGPAAFENLKLPDGSLLVKGRKVAVFTNEDEHAVGLSGAMPYLLLDLFVGMESEVVAAEKFTENAVRDGRLIIGQNPQSAKKTAELFVAAMNDAGPEQTSGG
jgi:putative intracellular protease/amidase